MNQVIVGSYEAGFFHVELVLREGQGGDCFLTPGDKPTIRIKVGAEYDDFKHVMAVLSHEIWETLLMLNKLRYAATEDQSFDTGAVCFMFDHSRFSDVNNCAVEYMEAARKPLKKAWKEWQK